VDTDSDILYLGTYQMGADTPEGVVQSYGNGWGAEVHYTLDGLNFHRVLTPGFDNQKNSAVYDIESGLVAFDNNYPDEGLQIFQLTTSVRGFSAKLAVPSGLGIWIRTAHQMVEWNDYVYCACDGPTPESCGTIWRINI